jgi:hypothetical protein
LISITAIAEIWGTHGFDRGFHTQKLKTAYQTTMVLQLGVVSIEPHQQKCIPVPAI